MMPILTQHQRLRERGPMSRLSDVETLTMEVVGSCLGISQDEALLTFFREHYTHFFPSLAHLHRSTFVRQAANLWAVKERLRMTLRDSRIRHDELIGSLTACPCRSVTLLVFPGVCAFGVQPATAKTTRIARRFTVFACICGWVGLASLSMYSWLLQMKPMGKSPV